MNILKFERIKNDKNGNPRYYIELDTPAREEDEKALKKIGLNKWRNGYGFKWWLQSYDTPSTIQKIIMQALND